MCRNTRCAFFFFIDYKNRFILVTDDPRLDQLRESVKKIVEDWNEKASIHDFRVVFGHTHTNLVFDVVVPYQVKMTEHEITVQLQKRVSEQIGKEYFIAINIDRKYI